MQISGELAVGVLSFVFAQGIGIFVYVVKAARYAGSADQHLRQIDDHLGRLNGRMVAVEGRVLELETDTTWVDRAIDLGNRISHVGQQTQALLQDANERRVKDGMPALWIPVNNGLS